MTPQGASTLIDNAFEHFHLCLPTFVPALPSIIIGSITTVLVSCGGFWYASKEKERYFKAVTLYQNYQWIVIALLSLFVGKLAGDWVRETHYTIRSVMVNRQHFANVHWLTLYRKAWNPNSQFMMTKM